MSRIFFWIILFGAGYWFWRRAKAAAQMAGASARAGTANGPAGARRAGGAPMPQIAEPMVRCAYCGAHSPRSDAVSLYREHFCNADHAQRFGNGERATGRE